MPHPEQNRAPRREGFIDLTDRARSVLKSVIESYLATGAPVGSRHLSQSASLNLSPASIRGVMHELEAAGLLAAPHTSAGRMPTDLGLRLFVDGMMQVAEPSDDDRRQIENRVGQSGGIAQAIEAASSALSGLSACAGLVLVPKSEPVLKQLAFVPLSDRQALAVIVGADGTVENRVIDLDAPVPASALTEAGNYITQTLAGHTLAQAQTRLRKAIEDDRIAIDRAARDLIEKGIASWSADTTDRPVLVVRGSSHLLEGGAVEDIERVRGLLDDLEGKQEIARLLGEARDGDATRIFIGSENNLFALSGSSVIAAPYRGSDNAVIGVVGVIGPVRLNYARIVPIVDFTAQTLSRLSK